MSTQDKLKKAVDYGNRFLTCIRGLTHEQAHRLVYAMYETCYDLLAEFEEAQSKVKPVKTQKKKKTSKTSVHH